MYAKNKKHEHIVSIPDDASHLKVIFTRDTWPLTPAHRLGYVTIDISPDNGATWLSHWLGCSLDGGEMIATDKITGEIKPINDVMIARFLPDGTNRKARINMEIAVALKTGISLEVS